MGTQAVLRYADSGNKALLVYHTFKNPEKLIIPLKGKWEIEKSLYDEKIELAENIVVTENREVFGNAILLEKSN